VWLVRLIRDQWKVSNTGVEKKSTSVWAILYLFQIRSLYLSPDERAEALTTLSQIMSKNNVFCLGSRDCLSQTSRPVVRHAHQGLPILLARARGSNVPIGSQRSIGERTISLRSQYQVARTAHTVANAAIAPARNV
jgi:hypothetical protein